METEPSLNFGRQQTQCCLVSRAEVNKLIECSCCGLFLNSHDVSQTATSHLCHHCHEMCGRGLVVQSLPWFDSEDPAVAVDGELGKRGGLENTEHATESAVFTTTTHTPSAMPLFDLDVFFDAPPAGYTLYTFNTWAGTTWELSPKPKPLLNFRCLAQM